MDYKKYYNLKSIGDLFELRDYYEKEIKKYEKYVYFIPFNCYVLYVKYCCQMLRFINILIKNKGYK